MPVISLPSTATADLVGPLPAGARRTIYSGVEGAAVPDLVDEIEFWVAEFGDWNIDAAAVFARMPKLRVIQVTSAGYDHVLPAVPSGVTLCNGRGVHGASTSEWVLTAILASLREIPRFVDARHERRWDHAITAELSGRVVLIIGAGDLGLNTAARVRAFDAEPVLVGRHARTGPEGEIHGTDELPELLPHADVVVLVVPKTEQTVGMVDAEFLARMRTGALLVNAARGPVVDTDALVAELTSGRLSAALDVTDPEPLPRDHPLWTAPNLLLTPHVGGSTLGFPRRAAALVREQIERYVAGQPLVNTVN